MVVGRAFVSQQGVGDEVDELGEGQGILVRAAAMTLEDAIEEVIGGGVIEEAEDGIGER